MQHEDTSHTMAQALRSTDFTLQVLQGSSSSSACNPHSMAAVHKGNTLSPAFRWLCVGCLLQVGHHIPN